VLFTHHQLNSNYFNYPAVVGALSLKPALRAYTVALEPKPELGHKALCFLGMWISVIDLAMFASGRPLLF